VPRFWAREKEHTAAAKAFSCSISAPVQQKIQDPIYIAACRAADDQAIAADPLDVRSKRDQKPGMTSGPVLLKSLVLALAAHGLSPESVTPWRGWLVFKDFVRSEAEAPDPGVSVQIARDDSEGIVSLIFVRQVVEQVDDWLEPVGGVVCEINFAQRKPRFPEFDVWSFDAPDFGRFVDLVESSADVEDLMLTKPLGSSVYWLET